MRFGTSTPLQSSPKSQDKTKTAATMKTPKTKIPRNISLPLDVVFCCGATFELCTTGAMTAES
jgi:hypothetical protein